MPSGMDERMEKLQSILFQAWSNLSSSVWTEDNPAKGQCSVTSLVVNELYGGELLKTATTGGAHFYNRVDGVRYDFTVSQFADPIEYVDTASSRTEAFTDTTEVQYDYLLNRVKSLMGADD